MARDKRKASPPFQSVSRKRYRTRSPDSQDTKSTSGRSRLVFRGDSDPYFPHADTSTKATLPPATDWDFRLEDVCDENQPDKIFRKAVQGLVKICFGDDTLQGLGVDIVAQHMREVEATDDQIQRMRIAFDKEMIHRMAWLLAQSMDTTRKLEAGIASVVAATHRLHGQNLDHQVLDDIISAFQKLKNKLPQEPSRQITSGSGLRLPVNDDDTDMVSTPVAWVNGSGVNDDANEVVISDPATPQAEKAETSTKRKRDPDKVSRSWRWDIDRSNFAVTDIVRSFKKYMDLFAYHALPIVKRSLGAAVDRKEICVEIERVWSITSTEDCDNWRGSYRKLLDGDLNMLDRGIPITPNGRRGITPAPPLSRASFASIETGTRSIKEEMNITNAAVSPNQLPSKDGQLHNIEILDQETPILKLLWKPLVPKDRMHFVDTTVIRLAPRITRGALKVRERGATLRTLTLENLGESLRNIAWCLSVSNDQLVKRTEKRLEAWVVASISTFPELRAQPFVFVLMMPEVTPVVDMLCTRNVRIDHANRKDVKDFVLKALEGRRVDLSKTIENKAGYTRIAAIIMHSRTNFDLKRLLLDRELRRWVFTHKESFADLKTSSLVQEWERIAVTQW